MKKVRWPLVVLPLLLAGLSGSSQTLQNGMRWEYLALPWFPQFPPQPVSLTIVDEVSIQGTTYFQLETEVFNCSYQPPVLIREENSRVYYRYGTQDLLLYDYKLLPGDTLWQTYTMYNLETSEYELMTYSLPIADTFSVVLNGETRRVQKWGIPSVPLYNDIGPLIIEGFGNEFYFFPTDGVCENLLCLRAVYWPNGDSTIVEDITNCYLNSATDLKDQKIISITPNPVQDVLFIDNLEAFSSETKVIIYDLYGRPVFKAPLHNCTNGISTHTWPPGIYILEVTNKVSHHTSRFLKTEN